MISKRVISIFLLAAATAVFGVACSGGGGSGDTSTASPTPFTPTNCQFAWINASTPGLLDAYIVDLPVANWTSGTKNFGPANSGIFLKDYDPNSHTDSEAAVTTNGSFAITATSTVKGTSVTFTDNDGGQSYLHADSNGVAIGPVVASNGQGSFTGIISDPNPSVNPDFGTGTITLRYPLSATSSMTLGQDESLAICYVLTPFAPLTPAERAAATLSRAQIPVRHFRRR